MYSLLTVTLKRERHWLELATASVTRLLRDLPDKRFQMAMGDHQQVEDILGDHEVLLCPRHRDV